MGLAPEPGVGERAAQTATAKSLFRIEYDSTELTLAWQNIPMAEQLICRKATGLPVETFTVPLGEDIANAIGEDSHCVLWWLARRAHGEFGLTFVKASEEWDVSKLGSIDVDIPDTTGDDPEA